MDIWISKIGWLSEVSLMALLLMKIFGIFPVDPKIEIVLESVKRHPQA